MAVLSSLLGIGAPPPVAGPALATTQFPPELAPYYKDILSKAQALYGEKMKPADEGGGYPVYQGPTIAEFTPEQEQAFTGITGLVGQQAPLFEEAQTLTRATAAPITAEEVGTYMNPYQQAVVDIEKKQAQERYESQVVPQLAAQAAMAQPFGGSRQAILEGMAGDTQQRLLADIQAKGSQQAYQQALQLAQDQRTREGQAGAQLATMAPQGLRAQLGEYGALQTVGEEKQRQTQAALDEAYREFLQQEQFPYRTLGEYQAIVQAQPASQMLEQTQYAPPPPSMSQQLIGGLGTLVGTYGAFGGFSPGGLFGNKTSAKTGGGIGNLPVIKAKDGYSFYDIPSRIWKQMQEEHRKQQESQLQRDIRRSSNKNKQFRNIGTGYDFDIGPSPDIDITVDDPIAIPKDDPRRTFTNVDPIGDADSSKYAGGAHSPLLGEDISLPPPKEELTGFKEDVAAGTDWTVEQAKKVYENILGWPVVQDVKDVKRYFMEEGGPSISDPSPERIAAKIQDLKNQEQLAYKVGQNTIAAKIRQQINSLSQISENPDLLLSAEESLRSQAAVSEGAEAGDLDHRLSTKIKNRMKDAIQQISTHAKDAGFNPIDALIRRSSEDPELDRKMTEFLKTDAGKAWMAGRRAGRDQKPPGAPEQILPGEKPEVGRLAAEGPAGQPAEGPAGPAGQPAEGPAGPAGGEDVTLEQDLVNNQQDIPNLIQAKIDVEKAEKTGNKTELQNARDNLNTLLGNQRKELDKQNLAIQDSRKKSMFEFLAKVSSKVAQGIPITEAAAGELDSTMQRTRQLDQAAVDLKDKQRQADIVASKEKVTQEEKKAAAVVKTQEAKEEARRFNIEQENEFRRNLNDNYTKVTTATIGAKGKQKPFTSILSKSQVEFYSGAIENVIHASIDNNPGNWAVDLMYDDGERVVKKEVLRKYAKDLAENDDIKAMVLGRADGIMKRGEAAQFDQAVYMAYKEILARPPKGYNIIPRDDKEEWLGINISKLVKKLKSFNW